MSFSESEGAYHELINFIDKTQKLPQKVSDGKRSLSLFMCIVIYVYN